MPDSELVQVPHGYLIDMEQEDETFYNEFTKAINDPSIRDANDEYNIEYGKDDPYLGMKLGIPRGPDDDIQHARVKIRVVDEEGKPKGIAHSNPLLDMKQYEVEFLDRQTEVMTANLIAENIIGRVDDEGHSHMMLAEIEDH